jgi:hypothetical protein
MKDFDFAHLAASLMMAKKLAIGATVFALSTAMAAASAKPQNIETIKVKGQIV